MAELLRKSGFPVVDADAIAHEGLRPGTPTYQAIVQKFGLGILDEQGNIQRRELGKIIFSDVASKVWLEELLHPDVQKRVRLLRSELEKEGHKLAFYEVPLLFEKNLQSQFDKVIVVWVSDSVQIARLMRRNSWSQEEIHQRNCALWPLSEKLKRADYAINNDGSLEDLRVKVEEIIKKLTTEV